MSAPQHPASGRVLPPPSRPQESIADQLRRAREKKKWTIEEVSVKTRIPLRHLETIEAGRTQELPGGFIGKSFVRQYAEALGLDGEQALRDFVAQTGVNLEVAFEERKVSPYTPESLHKFQAQMWRNIGLAAIAVLVVVLLVVYFVSRPATDGEEAILPTEISQPTSAAQSTDAVAPYEPLSEPSFSPAPSPEVAPSKAVSATNGQGSPSSSPLPATTAPAVRPRESQAPPAPQDSTASPSALPSAAAPAANAPPSTVPAQP